MQAYPQDWQMPDAKGMLMGCKVDANAVTFG
jgi:hypothetical protein